MIKQNPGKSSLYERNIVECCFLELASNQNLLCGWDFKDSFKHDLDCKASAEHYCSDPWTTTSACGWLQCIYWLFEGFLFHWFNVVPSSLHQGSGFLICDVVAFASFGIPSWKKPTSASTTCCYNYVWTKNHLHYLVRGELLLWSVTELYNWTGLLFYAVFLC